MNQSNQPKWSLIAHVREQIEAGTYCTDRRLELTVERIIERFYSPEDGRKMCSDLDLEAV